ILRISVLFWGRFMSGPITWGVLALPVALAGGMFCPAVASAYARRIDAGSTVDVATLVHAVSDAVRRRPGEPGEATAPWLAAGCVAALALACLPFMLQPSVVSAARALACGVLLLLALIDARTGLLPDALTLPLLCAGLLLAWAGLRSEERRVGDECRRRAGRAAGGAKEYQV